MRCSKEVKYCLKILDNTTDESCGVKIGGWETKVEATVVVVAVVGRAVVVVGAAVVVDSTVFNYLIHQKGIFKFKVQETKKIIVICIKRLLLMNLTPGVVVTAVVGAVVDVVSSTVVVVVVVKSRSEGDEVVCGSLWESAEDFFSEISEKLFN